MQKKAINEIVVIVFVIFCVATIDTQLFIYPSLSRSLLSEIAITTFLPLSLCFCFIKSKNIDFTKQEYFVFLWIAYVATHFVLCNPHEQYRTIYLIVSLLIIPAVATSLRCGLLTRRISENALIVVAVIHLTYIVAQLSGIIKSASDYFPLTGANVNPTSTALYLVGCVPLISSRVKEGHRRFTYLLLMFLIICSIAALRCRTAYIGLAVEFALYAALYVKTKITKIHTFYKALASIIVLLLITVTGVRMYSMKKDSADGRLLIWKISTEMVADNPLGSGYGLFAKAYNLKQGEYFANETGSRLEKRNADFVQIPYNDFLEHGVDGGIVGMMFLVAFYAIMIRRAVKMRMRTDLIVFTAFAVMSLTNFVYTSIQAWYCLMLYSAFVVTTQKQSDNLPSRRNVLVVVLLLMSVFLLYTIVKMTYAQLAVRQLKEKTELLAVDDSKYAEIEASVGTSEAYWTQRAKNSMAMQKYGDACIYLQNATNYTLAPSVIYLKYQCYKATNEREKAIACLTSIHRITPNRLQPLYLLMKEHENGHNMKEAKNCAREIIAANVKVTSDRAEMMKEEALNILNK